MERVTRFELVQAGLTPATLHQLRHTRISICFAAIPGTDPKPNSSIFLAKERWTVKTRLKPLNRQPLELNQTFSDALNRVLGWHTRERPPLCIANFLSQGFHLHRGLTLEA